jgi:hypothetical protein
MEADKCETFLATGAAFTQRVPCSDKRRQNQSLYFFPSMALEWCQFYFQDQSMQIMERALKLHEHDA